MQHLVIIIFFLLLTNSAAAVEAAAEAVVTVVEDLGVARTAWPITTGFPFPPGAVKDAASISLEDAAGSAKLPVQARVLTRWPDGSARWVLLDTALDLAARQSRKLRVRSGAPPKIERQLVVSDGEEAVRVDTGRLRFAVPKKKHALLDKVHLDGGSLPATVTSFMRFAEAREVARPPVSVKLLENGPLRARIELRGMYGGDFRYVIRIDAFAGQAFVRVLHTFENHGKDAYKAVRQIGIDVPFKAASVPSYQAGRVGREFIGRRVPDAGVRLVQVDNETLSVDGQPNRDRAAGWVNLHDEKRGVAVSARSFWQEYPQGFEIRRDGIRYDLWSPDSLPAVAGMGAAKTHEVVLAFHSTKTPLPGDLGAMIAPLVARIDPAWIHASGALPQAITSAGAGSGFLRALVEGHERYARRNAKERWDDSGQATCASGSRENPRVGAYGMWNWGDWNFPGYHDDTKGCDAWGNLEYDLTQVMALGFAGTQERRFYDEMVVVARHFMDVDTVHFQAARPQWVGMNHPKNPLHFTFELGGVDLGHTWNEGLLSYYYFTGDERGLESALGIADYLERRIRGGAVRGNPRQWGWPQIALVAAHDATLDRRYLDAAASYARGGMRAHPPTASHWKTGILAEALTYTHASAGDKELKKEIWEWLDRYSTAVLKAGVRDPRFFPAIAYVAEVNGDPAGMAAARAAAANLKLGAWGKPLTLGGRIGFRILSLTERTTAPST